MTINAINSVYANKNVYTNNMHSKSKVNFGENHSDEKTNSRKKTYIGLGIAAGLVVLGFAFRKKISNLSIFKKVKSQAETAAKPTVQEASKEAAKIENAAASVVKVKKSNFIFDNNALPQEERDILSNFYKKGKNKEDVYAFLRKHGMTEEQEKTVRSVVPQMKSNFAKQGSKAKPVTERTMLSFSFKAETPEKMVEDIVARAQKYLASYPVAK